MKNRKQPLFKSFGYAFEGIWTGISKERNMKIHCIAVILVTAVGTFVGLTPMEWCICLLLFGMVISLELVNTAVEAVVDLVTEERESHLLRSRRIRQLVQCFLRQSWL